MPDVNLLSYVTPSETDDQAAAINAAIVAANGGRVLAPSRVYAHASPIISQSMTRIEGSGAGTIFRALAGFAGVAQFTLGADATEQVSLANFTIDGNKAVVGSAAPKGVYFKNAGPLFPFMHTDAHDRINDLLIYNTAGDGICLDSDAAGHANPRETRIRGCSVYNANGHGVYLKVSSDVKVLETVAGNCGLDGFRGDSASASQFAHCKAFGSGKVDPASYGYGFRFKGGQMLATSCMAQDNTNHGFLSEAPDVVFSGCIADSNGRTTAPRSGFVFSYGYGSALGCHALDRWSGSAKVQQYGFVINDHDFQGSIVDYVRISGTARAHIIAAAPNGTLGSNNIIDVIGN